MLKLKEHSDTCLEHVDVTRLSTQALSYVQAREVPLHQGLPPFECSSGVQRPAPVDLRSRHCVRDDKQRFCSLKSDEVGILISTPASRVLRMRDGGMDLVLTRTLESNPSIWLRNEMTNRWIGLTIERIIVSTLKAKGLNIESVKKMTCVKNV
jgi:hypothetical protein